MTKNGKRSKPIKIAITNIHADGCYTAPIYVGSHNKLINATNPSLNYEDITLSESAIKKWPNIYLTMEETTGDIELTVSPQTYWQTGDTEDCVTGFAIDFEEDNQTILGLPFMNNYYCVFNRSTDAGLGVIKFATPWLPQ